MIFLTTWLFWLFFKNYCNNCWFYFWFLCY